MISYAQNLEDVMLARAFADRATGFYIDVGAGDPIADNVTKHFYDLGWNGINIEPHKAKFGEIAAARPRDINLPVAVSRKAGRATFFELEEWGLSSLKPEAKILAGGLGQTVRTYTVKTKTLSSICAQHVGSRHVDFLKIDVEGAEKDVLAGMDFAKYPATVVLVESTRPNTQIATHAEWEHFLLEAGYSFVYFDGLNRFYLHRKARKLRRYFAIPPNVFDKFKRQTEVFFHEKYEEAAKAVVIGNEELAVVHRSSEEERAEFARQLEREQAKKVALGQTIEQERAEKAALGQTIEQERAEKAALGQTIEQERAEKAALGHTLEEEQVEKAALSHALEQEQAAKAALGVALEQERVAKTALDHVLEQERAENVALGQTIARERADNVALNQTVERERADKVALGQTVARERGDKVALGQTVEHERVHKVALRHALEQERVDKAALGTILKREQAEKAALGKILKREQGEKVALGQTVKRERAEKVALGKTLEREQAEKVALGKILEREQGEKVALGQSLDWEQADKFVLARTLKRERAEKVALSQSLEAERADKVALDQALQGERSDKVALDQALQGERSDKVALGQALEQERSEKVALGQVLEKERAEKAALGKVLEQERLERRQAEALRTWNVADWRKQTEVKRQNSLVSYFERQRQGIYYQIARMAKNSNEKLRILERHLGRDGTEVLYRRSYATLDRSALAEIAASPFWRDVVLPLEGKERLPGLFDAKYYLAENPDVQYHNFPPLRHYILFGAGEGRNPNPLFDASWYLTRYSDLAPSGQNPLFHFANWGAPERRSPHALFDTERYVEQNPDVLADGTNPLLHYLRRRAILAYGADPALNSDSHSEQTAEVRAAEATAFEQSLTSTYRLREFFVGDRHHAKSKKPVIICISHVFPWPARAGNEYRIARILDWLSQRGHELLLVIAPMTSDEIGETQRNILFNKYRNVIVCYRDGRVLTSIKTLDLSFTTIDGISVAEIFKACDRSSSQETEMFHDTERRGCHEALIGLLVNISEQVQNAIYYINYAFMTRFLGYTHRRVWSFVDTHDIFSQKRAKVLDFGIRNDIEMTEKDERRMLERANALIAIQANDAQRLAALIPNQTVITAGVDFSFEDVGPRSRRPTILLVAYNNALNVKGVADFLRYAWPLIKRAVRDVEFVVVGSVAEAFQNHDPQVRFTGVVDSLGPYYRDARVVVNPAVAGTGLKIKTVESIAYLRPIVTWPNGADGITEPLLRLCHVAENWYEFADQTIALLSAADEVPLPSCQPSSIKRVLQANVVYDELNSWLTRFD